MTQRSSASFAIPWDRTATDGVAGAPLADLRPGAAWRWTGQAARLDGRPGVLRLGEGASRRDHVARTVARLSGLAAGADDIGDDDDPPLSDDVLVLTDGLRRFALGLVLRPSGAPLLALAFDALPPRDTDLWIVRHERPRKGRAAAMRGAAAAVGLAAGSRVATPAGPVAVEHLREGDTVLDHAGAPHPVAWIGRRDLSAAQLTLRPDLRPLRLGPGALAPGRPHAVLRVAPGQRVLIEHQNVRALFNADAVLVEAGALAGRADCGTDLVAETVAYFTLFLPRHAILRVEGLDVESLHPAGGGLASVGPQDRARFAARWPGLMADPTSYGPPVRRWLAAGEAAILAARAA